MSSKKSQIQQIKEGRAMRERTWSGRVQPFGPMAKQPDQPGVRLSPKGADEGGMSEPWRQGKPEASEEKVH